MKQKKWLTEMLHSERPEELSRKKKLVCQKKFLIEYTV
jgi:hypothetical protein